MIGSYIKSDLIRNEPLPGHTCPNCHKTDGMDMELRQRYAEFATMIVNPKGVFRQDGGEKEVKLSHVRKAEIIDALIQETRYVIDKMQ